MPPYDCIFINGDSYSAPSTDCKVYGDFLSEFLNIPVKNYAVPGSSNDRILRTSIEFLTQLKTEYKNPLVLVGWSFINRLEIWEHRDNLAVLEQAPDKKYFPGTKFITLDRLLNTPFATVEQKALINNDPHGHKQLMNFYTSNYLFCHLLESLKLDYLLFLAANNDRFLATAYPAVENYSMVQWVKSNKKIYNLDNFCIQIWAKDNDPDCKSTGHLSENGHKKFAQVLLDVIKEQYGNI